MQQNRSLPFRANENQSSLAEVIELQTYPIAHNYLKKLSLWIGFWTILTIASIWVINPYGVSPINVTLHRINDYKPKRLDIDRLIKPYEVWLYQPKTIFLGTSRIHQSIDPSTMDNTKFAPAYNASIPASTLSQNAAYLEEYLKTDKNLHYVFIELFIYNFIFPQPEAKVRTFNDAILSTTSLMFSSDALIDAFKTIKINHSEQSRRGYVTPLGNWIRPESSSTAATFDAKTFVSNIMNIHQTIPDMIIQPSATEAINRIVSMCREHNVELFMIITPSYPWDDHRLLSLGYWPLLEEWIKQMSTYKNVYSFSQYNSLLEEPAGEGMKWWNDPLHLSPNYGRAMIKSFLGNTKEKIPKNLLRHVTPATYKSVLHERRHGLSVWSHKNPHFIKQFDTARDKNGNVVRVHKL